MKKVEILAPAGSYESVTAAVRCGANAIYLGGSSFSARQNATNFTDEELKTAVSYCHMHGVKVYQAVNTIVFDTQLEELEKTIRYSAQIGVDAVIVQDFGVAKVIKTIAPEMPVHASTQMTINSVDGALFAKRMGFDRVVLARELSSEQIRKIASLGIETEVFVHGALCMCISGQCYMSAMIGSRSANRGLCAQACRLPFSALDGQTDRHDLSLKDMCLIEYVKELSDMGVTSLKIEGRMKRPEYVAAASSAYRKAADGEHPDIDTLKAVFSRSGFTDGYYTDKINSSMFGIRGKDDVVSAGDVLPELKEFYRKEKKSAKISFSIEIKQNLPIKLCAKDNDGNIAEVTGEIPQSAINRPVGIELVEKQLSKLGDTIYELENIEADIDDGLSVSASSLNSLRRNASSDLDNARIKRNTPVYKLSDESVPMVFPKFLNLKHQAMRLMLDKAEQLSDYAAENAEFIILPLKEVIKHDESLKKYQNKIILSIPAFLANFEKEYENLIQQGYKMGYTRLLCANVAHIEMALKYGFSCYGGFELNISNSLSMQSLAELDFEDTVVSFEMKTTQINTLADFLPYGILAYGRIPLMKVRNCPVKGAVGKCSGCTGHITDRTGRIFPVSCNGIYSEILNSEVLYMADRMREVHGISFYILKFCNETKEEVERIVKLYENGSKPPFDKFTRGLYYRGIL